MTIDIDKLEKFLLKKLIDEVEDEWSEYSFTEDGPGTIDRQVIPAGEWLFVKILVNYSGRTMDPSTDRLKGDPEDVHGWYTWIGLNDTAPKKVSKPEELDNWAHISTYYRLTFRDVQYPGPFGFHEGRMVKDFNPDKGTVDLYIVTERRFQDEAPISKTKEETIDLNKIKKE
ncbi:MAG: hypothetical protein FK733_02445 [Asgard group archaeon]|nr:hypothetical protein [Asgard group archaeon]